jgi:hypothetical protein
LDNTPLGAVLDRLDKTPDVHRTGYVVNLISEQGAYSSKPAPDVVANEELTVRQQDIGRRENAGSIQRSCRTYGGARKTSSSKASRRKFGLQSRQDPRLCSRTSHCIDSASHRVDQFDDSDFSVEIMKSREQKGYTETKRVLVEQKLRAQWAATYSEPSAYSLVEEIKRETRT